MRRMPAVLGLGVCLLLLPGGGRPCAADAPPPPSVTGAQGPAFPFRAGYPADTGGSGHQERNLLSLPRQRLASGDTFSADVRVYDEGGYDYYFNVFWDRRLPLPGELALYDAQKHWLRDLTASTHVARREPKPSDWTPIQAPGYIGTVVDCGALSVPPGLYYVQAIFFGSLIHPPPDRSAEGWPALDDQNELMRSEAIPLTVVAPEAVGAAPREKGAHGPNPPAAVGGSPFAPQGAQGGVSSLPNPDYPFRDSYPIPKSDSWGHSGHGVLSLPIRILHPGQPFNVDVRVYNDGGSDDFFNVFWNGLLPQPGGLALYDGRKRFVCDLLRNSGGSRRRPESGDWTGIEASGYAGRAFSVSLPSLSGLGDPVRPLPAGTYYLQVIFVSGAVAPPHAFGTAEAFRSNAVEVMVVD